MSLNFFNSAHFSCLILEILDIPFNENFMGGKVHLTIFLYLNRYAGTDNEKCRNNTVTEQWTGITLLDNTFSYIYNPSNKSGSADLHATLVVPAKPVYNVRIPVILQNEYVFP